MRLKKNPKLIDTSSKSGKITPFRTIVLDEWEISETTKFLDSPPSEESEELLKHILAKRNMESLLYSDKKNEQWSGYVKLIGNQLWLI